MLTLAIPRSDVKPVAKSLLAQFGDLRAILDAPIDELMEVRGIGSVAPVALSIIKSAAVVYLQQTAVKETSINEGAALADFWRMRIGALPYEVFEVGFLDSSLSLLRDGVERLEEGTVDRATVYPRRVIEAALKRGAYGLVLAHNHPNGSVDPTEHDRLLTRAIALAADAIQLKVLDHLVVSANDTFSFRKAGLL